ncbi:MAG: FtsX-like permease family protein [Spirochaetaceae bacterium]|nr:FtsX-like permease family protein [Spirochaetaceae bacterium]
MTALRGARARSSWRLIPLFAWRILARRRGAGGAAGGSAYLTGAAVGIGLSLVPLLVVMEVSDGLIEGITRRFLEVGSYHLQVRLPPGLEAHQRVRARLLDEVAARLQQGLGEGALASRERHGTALAAAGGRRHVVTVRALAEQLWERDPGLRQYLAVASGAFDLSGNGIVVSRDVARRLDAQVGDRLLLVTAIDRGAGTGRALLIPKLTPLEVRGIVTSGYQELDKLWVFVSHATAEVLLPPGGSRDLVGVKIADPFADLRPVIERTASLAGPGYAIFTWRELERANYESFATSRALLLLIMALIVAVAGVNVSSATMTIALARRREMAFLKSQGLPPEVVFWTLTASGVLAGALGAAVGIGAGLAAALNINQVVTGLEAAASALRTAFAGLLAPASEAPAAVRFFDRGFYLEQIPITVEPGPVVVVAGATIALAGLAAALPAARAAARLPLELLRGTPAIDADH